MSETRTVKAYAALEAKGDCKEWEYTAPPVGPLDIEIKISHCGICGTDIHTIDSGWGPTGYPCVPGHEIVGTVEKAGDKVTRMKVGDRVGVGYQQWACLNRDNDCNKCRRGDDNYCPRWVATNAKYESGNTAHGGFADYIRLENNYAFKIPDNINSDVATSLMCAGATVFTPLRRLGVKEGDRVGVVGIGGLGHLALQFINALGATPIAFSRSADKEKEARELGAKEFVNVSDENQVKNAGESCDYLLLTANATDMPYDMYLSFLDARGTMAMVGIPEDQVKFIPFMIVGFGKKVMGSKVGSIEDITAMLELAAKKNVRPIIEKMPMEKVNEGLQKVRDGKARFRCVLENKQ